MHLWLLWGPRPLTAHGEDRVGTIVIGKPGVQIGRGRARGLLLPSVALDYGLDARAFLQQVCLKAGLPKDTWKDDDTSLLVFEGYAVEGRLQAAAERPMGWEPCDVRPPAVAGGFYPGTGREIQRRLDEMFVAAAEKAAARGPVSWCRTPAGFFSGRLAAAVFQRVQWSECAIILCPKHRPSSTTWAVTPDTRWLFPGGELASDPAMAKHLADAVTGLTLDAVAHGQEHAIEVQLPLLAQLAHAAAGGGDRGRRSSLAGVIAFWPTNGGRPARFCRSRPLLLVVFSDMNHFADDAETRRLDQLALDAIQTLDPVQVYETVKEERISMCGASPCTVVMEALRCLKALHRC